MCCMKLVAVSVLLGVGLCSDVLTFPPGFMFGAATSSYQVEGGWNASDKSMSIWDTFVHEHNEIIADGSTGDIACDSYHLWKRDIEMLKELGVDFYRFSISWTRLVPTGHINRISEDGKRYYNNLIDGLLMKGIEPAVTIYHWDLPQHLQDLGGWTNPYISDWFADYARVVFSLFGDRVKIWITINEPIVICDIGYGTNAIAPGTVIPDKIGTYLCNKNLMIAHAKAYRIYDKEFRPKYHGMISIVNQLFWFAPLSLEDTHATNLALQNVFGRYTHPIFSKEGGWPADIERIVAINSEKQGYYASRLPAFTKEEIELVRGTFDFFGMNHYTSRLVRERHNGENVIPHPLLYDKEFNYVFEMHPDWKTATNGWLALYPEGFRYLLQYIKKQYGDVKILITENGYATDTRQGLVDDDRIEYYRTYIEQMLLAIKEDGVNVIGYTAWSLMDNFEWMDGYKSKFGLYEVDFSNPHRTRTPRKSVKFFADLIKNRQLNGTDKYKSELYSWHRQRSVVNMCYWQLVAFSVIVSGVWCSELLFPPDFLFGASTSAYQIEGAWNVSDKSKSIYDHAIHNYPSIIVDNSTGDVACDSYHHWKKDVQMAAELGLQFYRFSISWPRLLPLGLANYVSKDGAAYYNNLINELLRKGIQPIVTLHHFDLPQSLQDLGGWTNPTISEWFTDYARVAYSLYADRVKTWITINEPIIICDYSYGTGNLPPLVKDPMLAPYLCNKNILISHAKAWRLYDKEYRPLYHGEVSITNHLVFYKPATNHDVGLAELAMEFCTGRYSHPIYSEEGGWPPVIEQLMAEISRNQGYTRSRLPPFTKEEIELVKGTYDFYAMNQYTSRIVRPAKPGEGVGAWFFDGWPDMNAVLEVPKEWKMGVAKALAMYPEGIRQQMLWLKKHYGNIKILITENGYSVRGDGVDDDDQIDYMKQYMEQVLLSMKEDGVKVTGYGVWSLMDNFEWSDGYRPRFGLYEVDFSDPKRPRYPRKSAYYYANIIKGRSMNATDVFNHVDDGRH
ncbi:lactase/phlorizin hydrolase-like [Galleria mellonella]|uniref:Lactase/phlorizin hydrolase-like n=1 Tax=Galleria mellonella TaxID=7137 RepID=A0ABM3N6L5_GALME|nr:lactase/phlorizin hydrolase-like [Galleria mellonella]